MPSALRLQAILAPLMEVEGAARPADAVAPAGCQERPAPGDVPMLEGGEVEVQDEGSQLVALLVGARPGMQVVDRCAGAGGEALALAADREDRGHLVACDVSEGRLERAAERSCRAVANDVETRLLASETHRWVERRAGRFDRVLVDAPCSGTGTGRRDPDARWRAEGAGLDTLLLQQARILTSAARLVKPGGRLVYATCSLLPEENEAWVEGVVAAHPGFRAVPVAAGAAGSAHPEYLALTPARHCTDWFFTPTMER